MKHIPHGAHLDSLGHLSQTFQRSPAEIEKILDVAKLEPALVLNGIRYFDRSAYLAIREATADGE